ncbi:membrane metallo-endopeptidase-like 1 isoform X7 [Aphis gossypii]|uniref:membrane metallo-endopeptidase-like 1 isoform X3 n=1 Tax=Aphis gossypii TaxID=80765 RepID=UPI00215914E6|nr:membrane metallo-endopeptidase-like 1 isoform X3 [Aphis gossypii]XP_050056334.1 membrane metallo-endopeptidase-like 1 isoform X4 [Aphis gossypii]XP_050056335.1 membrane metallo-endopeptidase-like 1 isoform X5 [Aphis gossypii]XP_050056337.1 membrane metallo-endopeptidase-like 1 isoform X7 [Aphis gossypii]
MGFEEHFEGKGISSFTISQNGNVNIQKKYSKKKISISILTVIAISLAAIFIYYSYIRPEYTICQTKSCLRSAVTLINCMNETVEPCEDFYEFACGMFETNYPYYSNTNENSWMTIMTLKIKHRVKKFLNKENEKYEPTAVHKTRKFYQVCLNSTEDQNSIKYDPLWNVWKKIGLNTDYLNDSVPLEIETILARVGVHFSLDIFFQIDIEADPRNSSSHLLLNIDQNLELNKYKERKNLKTNNVNIEEDLLKFSEYFNLLVDKLLNRNQSYIKKFTVQSLLNTTNKLVQFREEFSQVSQDSFNLKNDIPEVITLRELQEFTDITGDKLKFNWTLYLRELTRDVQPKVYEILTSEKANNYELLISNRDHLNKVFILLSQTPTIIIKMYILFHVVAALENNLPSGETFNAEYCLSLTSEFFGMVTGYSMINTLDNSSKASATVTLINCMNETVEPCEDFYEFACGMFETNYPYYSDENKNSWPTIISLKLKKTVKKFLNKQNEKHEPLAVHKTRKFYQVCLNSTKDQDSIKYDPQWDILKKIGLNTDYLNDSVSLEMETILARIGVYLDSNIFFNIFSQDDPRNSSSHLLLAISRNWELNEYKERNNTKPNNINIEEALPKFSEYFNLLVDKLLYRNQTCTKKLTVEGLVNTTNELVHFREELLKVSYESFFINEIIPDVMTLRELQELTDITGDNFKFNWTLYLRELTRDIQPKVYEILTSEKANNYELIIYDRDHINKMFLFLSQTPTIILKMHILSRVVAILENRLPSGEKFNSEHCFSLTNKFFYMATGYSMRNALDDTSKVALNEMTDNIKWAFKKIVHETSWMDDETKNAALRKLANMKTYFGYPNNYNNVLNNFFENLNVTDNHIANLISIQMFNTKRLWKYLTEVKEWNDQTWLVQIYPTEVIAFYFPALNAFVLPVSILQAPIYYNENSVGIQAFNYGNTGSTIGHELSHGFDNINRLYNELGNLVNWWTNKSDEEYTKRANCLINRYDGIKVVNHNSTYVVNGTLTLDENMADIVGLKEAYYAYLRYVEIHGQEPRLPGLERYSQEQLFFLAYANQFCHYDENAIKFDIYHRHSPYVVRVREVLSLLPEFAKAWSCPIGTPMNPKKDKCQIW